METVFTQLESLMVVLQRHQVWEQISPSESALQSDVPFAADVLSCTQWLQWIFMPRIRLWASQPEPLPFACAISPYVEVCTLPLPLKQDLLLVLQALEESLNPKSEL